MSTDAPVPDDASPVTDPIAALAARLHEDSATAEVAALDEQGLAELTAMAVNLARAAPDEAWKDRLLALRRTLLMRNQRPAYALVLAGLSDVTRAIGDTALRLEVLGRLLGVRDLLQQPWQAHEVALQLAEAQAEAGERETAEATLLMAVERARKLAPGGNLDKASARVSRTLVQLGELLARQGRKGEAEEWLSGALDLAPDEESRAHAGSALQRLQAG